MNSKNSSVEVVLANSKKVSCDGNSAASSHPLVYLNIGEKDHIICPYCSKYFELSKEASTNNSTH